MTRSKTVEINSLWEWKGWNGDTISAVVDDEHSGITKGVIKMDDSAATAVRLLSRRIESTTNRRLRDIVR